MDVLWFIEEAEHPFLCCGLLPISKKLALYVFPQKAIELRTT